MSEIKKMFALYGIMCIAVIGINLALLAAAVWVAVKVLQWMGVL